MADLTNVWPSDVPTSYSGEPFAWPQYQSLPALYGIDLANPFFLSFLIGAAFVAFFSVARFNQRSQDALDPVTAESRLLQELTPMDLRDPRLIVQSYVLYAAVLLGIYTALTFFGSLILNTVNTIVPVAGYTTDLGQYDFTSPQWPLFVALGMVGVLPVLKPVEAVEIRLRRWTHRAVGIPLTIYRHAEAMRLQYRMLQGARPGAGPVFDGGQVPDWLRRAVGDDRAIAEGFEAREQLEVLSGWIKDGRGEWPSGQSDRQMERLFDLQYLKAREALRGFAELVDPKNAAAGPLPEQVDDPAALLEHQARHIAKLRAGWDKVAQEAIDARDSLFALLSVGAEKQNNYALIAEDGLRHLLRKAIRVDDFQSGPQLGIVLLLPILFFVYAFAIYANLHAPFNGANNTQFSVVVIAAAYEILLICAIFLFPLMAAMNYRFWRKVAYRGRWEQLHYLDFEQRSMLQVVAAAGLALGVALVCLSLLAVAQAGLVARGTSEFRRLLTEAKLPLLPLALSLAGISIIFCLGVLFAVEERENHRAAGDVAGANRPAFGLGLLVALAVLGYQLVYTYLWYRQIGMLSCPGDSGPFFTELFRPGPRPDGFGWLSCARFYGLTSFVVYTLIAFLAVTIMIPQQRPVPGAAAVPAPVRPPAPPAATGRPSAVGGAAAVVLLAALILTLTIGHALGAEAEDEGRMVTDRRVVVGFRTDAPPFSYLRQFGEEKRYAGYLADLCNLIFTGDATHRFEMVSVPVTAADRFTRLVRRAGEHWDGIAPLGPETKVDLLCDPVTLRYSAESSEAEGARRTDGIFSPIVYVTGVSYLARSGGGTKAAIGFVRRTTAGRVAVEACIRDGLRIRDNSAGFQPDIHKACQDAAAEATQVACRRDDNGNEVGPEADNYVFCGFDSHADLVGWFCPGIAKDKRFYFGDKDLILGQVETWEAAGNLCYGVSRDYPFRSYEPYALLVSKVNPDLVQFVQRRIYEIFSDREQVLSLFTGNFRGKAMSTPLANLFNLNGVEDQLELAPETFGSTAALGGGAGR